MRRLMPLALLLAAGCGDPGAPATLAPPAEPTAGAPEVAPPPHAPDPDALLRRALYVRYSRTCHTVTPDEAEAERLGRRRRERWQWAEEELERAGPRVLPVITAMVAEDEAPGFLEDLLELAAQYPLQEPLRDAVRARRDRRAGAVARGELTYNPAHGRDPRGWYPTAVGADALVPYFVRFGDATDLRWLEYLAANHTCPDWSHFPRHAADLRARLAREQRVRAELAPDGR